MKEGSAPLGTIPERAIPGGEQVIDNPQRSLHMYCGQVGQMGAERADGRCTIGPAYSCRVHNTSDELPIISLQSQIRALPSILGSGLSTVVDHPVLRHTTMPGRSTFVHFFHVQRSFRIGRTGPF